MKIKLAKNYGFCFGVKRAVEIAQNNPNASTIGPLIHNPKEIQRLKDNFQVDTLKDASQIDFEALKTQKKTFIVRTHGITKNDLAKLKATNANIIDATCPYVTKPQQIASDMKAQGYQIIIFGDADHPEVKGIKSYSTIQDKIDNYPTLVTKSFDDIAAIKLKKRVALISQTTKKTNEYLAFATKVATVVKELRIFNTICNATFDNQDAARELAQESDIMVVIGGRNSSNTKQLFEISKSICRHTYLIEEKTELEASWFQDKSVCGITAGASTPKWIIDDVIAQIKTF